MWPVRAGPEAVPEALGGELGRRALVGLLEASLERSLNQKAAFCENRTAAPRDPEAQGVLGVEAGCFRHTNDRASGPALAFVRAVQERGNRAR